MSGAWKARRASKVAPVSQAFLTKRGTWSQARILRETIELTAGIIKDTSYCQGAAPGCRGLKSTLKMNRRALASVKSGHLGMKKEELSPTSSKTACERGRPYD